MTQGANEQDSGIMHNFRLVLDDNSTEAKQIEMGGG